MSHLVESYALSCGLKIDKPFIYEQFFSIPFEKFICIHTGGAMPAKQYDYYEEVVDLLLPVLKRHNYALIQIGGKEDTIINSAINYAGQTTIHQTAYILRHASLLIGNDSCNVHMASMHDTPIVSLYGPTTPYNHGPYFSSPEKVSLIEADLQGKKPSYSATEIPKTINRILPEEVAKSVVKLLKLDEEIKRETIYIGSNYGKFGLWLVPDSVVSMNFLPEAKISIRMDYLFDESVLENNLSQRTFQIVTNKPINERILSTYKKNIINIIYMVEEDYSVEFVDLVRRSGINYMLVSKMSDLSLAQAKLDFFDYGIIVEEPLFDRSQIEKADLIDENTKFRTQKFILSRDTLYTSKKNWQNGINIDNFSQNTATIDPDDESFYKDITNYYIFNE